MFCPSCGAQVAADLRFCNRCGAALNMNDRHVTQHIDASQESLVWALAVVTIAGLGALIGMMAVMTEVVHFNIGLTMAFSLLVLAIVLGVDGVIVSLLLKSRRGSAALLRTELRDLTTNELQGSKAHALQEPAFGITDHTTHTLDAAERTRRSE